MTTLSELIVQLGQQIEIHGDVEVAVTATTKDGPDPVSEGPLTFVWLPSNKVLLIDGSET